MYDALKPLLVILVLCFIVFRIAQPICLQFMDAKDFFRRRNVWLAVTALEFVTPNYWIFAGFAIALIYWAGSADRHPTALYVLLMVCIPPAEMLIPMPLVNQLFGLSTTRILALALVIPACIRMARAGTGARPGAVRIDWILLAYGALQLVLYAEFESSTNTLRRAALFGMDVFALYFLFSRGAATRKSLTDTLACLWLTAALQVPIAVFESLKGWLLYTEVVSRWGVPNVFAWLMRGDSLRAQGPAGHSLTMGFIFAMGFGAWLYLGRRIDSKRMLLPVGLAMWAGLIATYSRAPWIVAGFVFLVYTCFAPGGVKNVGKTLLAGCVTLAVLSFTPMGTKLISLLPFIGTQDQGNVDYREELATVSWQLIKQHPWFGNPFALGEMEDLRQGQGIIDLVNTYATIALFYGGVGVTLFVACFIYPLGRTFLAVRRVLKTDVQLAGLGAALIACSLGVLLMMATASFGDAFAGTAWLLTGLCCAFPLTTVAEAIVAAPRPLRTIRRSAFS